MIFGSTYTKIQREHWRNKIIIYLQIREEIGRLKFTEWIKFTQWILSVLL